MFDIKQLDNAYDPAEQIQIALGVHPDQADAQQTTADALAAAGINPSTSARAFDVGSNPKPADDTQAIAPIARPNGARAINMGDDTTTDSGAKMIPPIASSDTPQSAISVNPMSSNDARLAGHKSELDRLQNSTDHDGNIPTGGASGIAQIQNPFLRGLARVGDIAGKVMFPIIEREIPGTEGHHQALVNEAQGNVASDLGEQSKELALTHQKLENDALDNKPAPASEPLFDKTGDIIGFKKNGEWLPLGSPKLSPDENSIGAAAKGKSSGTPEAQAMTDLVNQANPATGKPYTPYEAYSKIQTDNATNAKGKSANDFEQYYSDYLKDNNLADSAHNRLAARERFVAAGQAPQHEPRQLAVGPDGKVIELKPGVTVPSGSKTVSGDLATPKPNADEQKRADLVENLNENLDQLEDIVKRRPDLFGKVAGRETKAKEWLGSDDQDVAALKGIEDRLGMVQQSSHGMRSALHVEASANSVLNGFKNGPDAMLRSIADARKSGKTFTDDVQRGQPQAPKSGSTGKPPSGGKEIHYKIVNGQLVPQ